MKLTILLLTPDLWPALEDLFGKSGAWNGCWCMYWRIGSAYRKRPRQRNKTEPLVMQHRRADDDVVQEAATACGLASSVPAEWEVSSRGV